MKHDIFMYFFVAISVIWNLYNKNTENIFFHRPLFMMVQMHIEWDSIMLLKYKIPFFCIVYKNEMQFIIQKLQYIDEDRILMYIKCVKFMISFDIKLLRKKNMYSVACASMCSTNGVMLIISYNVCYYISRNT